MLVHADHLIDMLEMDTKMKVDSLIVVSCLEEFSREYFGDVIDEDSRNYVDVYRYEFNEIIGDIFAYAERLLGQYGSINESDVYGAVRMRISESFGEVPNSEATYMLLDLVKIYEEARS